MKMNEEKENKSVEVRKKKFLEVFRKELCNISATCEKLKISRDTYYKWLKKDKKFKKSIEEVKDLMINEAETQLLKNIKMGKETSLIFFLVNRAPDRWRSINKVEHPKEEFKMPIIKFVPAPPSWYEDEKENKESNNENIHTEKKSEEVI